VTPQGGVNAGQSFILPHSDTGPGAGHGEKLDFNAPASQMVFGSMKDSALQGGSYLKYIGANLPEGVTPGMQPSEGLAERFNLSDRHREFIQQQGEARKKSLELAGSTPVPGARSAEAPSSQAMRSLRGQRPSAQGEASLGIKRDTSSRQALEHGVENLKQEHRIAKNEAKRTKEKQSSFHKESGHMTHNQQANQLQVADSGLVMAAHGFGY
jgi:hypothetical protein